MASELDQKTERELEEVPPTLEVQHNEDGVLLIKSSSGNYYQVVVELGPDGQETAEISVMHSFPIRTVEQ